MNNLLKYEVKYGFLNELLPQFTPMDDNATAEDALLQINNKDYAIPYIADHRKIVKVGVEFSQTERGVKRWLIE
jgi:hypothetical protein